MRNLKQHVNYARWIEYAFSASWMIVIIAMITGMSDLSSLLLIGFLNMTMLLFGLLMERFNKANEKVDWLPFYFGCIGWIVPWVTIVLFVAGANGTGGGKVPGFVYGIMVSLFVFFSIFALNMVLQYKRVGKWRDYLYGEKRLHSPESDRQGPARVAGVRGRAARLGVARRRGEARLPFADHFMANRTPPAGRSPCGGCSQ